jgi:hypothetical protein
MIPAMNSHVGAKRQPYPTLTLRSEQHEEFGEFSGGALKLTLPIADQLAISGHLRR